MFYVTQEFHEDPKKQLNVSAFGRRLHEEGVLGTDDRKADKVIY